MSQSNAVGGCLKQWLASLLGRRCVLCFEPCDQSNLCPYCAEIVPTIGHACHRCALPLARDEGTAVCGACLSRPRIWQEAIAAAVYAPPVDEMISSFKFGHDLATGQALASLLLARAGRIPVRAERVLIPVPLHRARLRERGFNQALELALPVGRALGLKVDHRLLQRQRATSPQSSTADMRERASNIRGAFSLRGQAPKSVVLVDDVLTTGATLTECARTLRAGGAAHIEVWVVARTLHSGAAKSQ